MLSARAVVVAVAILISAVSGIWTGGFLARSIATQPRFLVGAVLDATSLRRLGLRALELDIANSEYIAGVNRGPLDVDVVDVSRVLDATYAEAATSEKAREVQQAFLEFIERYPADSIFRISIERERPTLADSLGGLLVAKYRALPDCGFTDDVSALFSALDVRIFGGSGDEFYYEDHPNCRPPDVVASRVEEGIRAEFARTATSGPDSVDVVPDEPGDPGFANALDGATRVLHITAWWWPAILLSIGAAVAAVAGPRRGRWRVGAAFGSGLMLYGLAARLFAPGYIDAALAGRGTIGEASEVWAALGIYGFQRIASVSGSWALVAGAAVAGTSLLVAIWIREKRRGSTAPAPKTARTAKSS